MKLHEVEIVCVCLCVCNPMTSPPECSHTSSLTVNTEAGSAAFQGQCIGR